MTTTHRIKWPRIKTYKRMYIDHEGIPRCEQANFTELQLRSIPNAVCHEDGINLPHAIDLIERWNRQCGVQGNLLGFSIFY